MSECAAPVRPVCMDWPQIVRDLEARGLTQYRIAKLLGLETSTVQHWARVQGDIGWGYGRALMSLHLAYCGESCTVGRVTEAKSKA